MSSKHEKSFAFPPFCVITFTLQKVRQDQATEGLVVPDWPTQGWFPMVPRLLLVPPVRLPRKTRLLPLPSKPAAVQPLIRMRMGMKLSWVSIGPARYRRRFDSPMRRGIFLQESYISVDFSTVSAQPRVQSHAFTSVHTLKIPWSFQRSVDYGNTEHPACTVGWVA